LLLHCDLRLDFAGWLAVDLWLRIATRAIADTLDLRLRITPSALYNRSLYGSSRSLHGLLIRRLAGFASSASELLLDLRVSLRLAPRFFLFLILRVRLCAERQCDPEA
jgi:hypothetical protein